MPRPTTRSAPAGCVSACRRCHQCAIHVPYGYVPIPQHAASRSRQLTTSKAIRRRVPGRILPRWVRGVGALGRELRARSGTLIAVSEDDRDAAHGAPGLGIQAIAAGGSALAGYLLGGADGALSGAVATPYLTVMLGRARDEVFADRQRRADAMLEAAAEAADMTADELADAATKSEETRFLADAALRAATETMWPPGVRALGRALAAGLIAGDDTIIDIPKMVLPVMAEMGSPHVQVLELLVMYRWSGGPKSIDGDNYVAHMPAKWTARQIIAARPALKPVLEAVTGTLDGYGLIRQNNQTGEALARYSQQFEQDFRRANRSGDRRRPLTQVNPPQRMVGTQASRLAPEPTWSPNSLGKQVLKYYEEAGAVDDQMSL